MNTTSTAPHIGKLIGPDKVIDVREIPCSIKHGLILRNCFELAVGDHFILQNGRDPVHLRNDISESWPDAFAWEYLVRNDEGVHVKITKLKTITAKSTAKPHNCGGH
jgi:uncharacterized protein (DUF2249 family)